jgi:hypothetical protein
MIAELEIQIVSYLYTDDTQGALVSFVLAVIKDLDRDHGRILDRTVHCS